MHLMMVKRQTKLRKFIGQIALNLWPKKLDHYKGKAWVDSDQLGTSTAVDDSYDSVKASILEKERKARIEKMTAQILGPQLQNHKPNFYEIDGFIDRVITLAETMVDRIDVKYGD